MVKTNKIKVHYVCGGIGEPGKGQVWGGTVATNYTIKQAFKDSKDVDLVIKPRNAFNDISEVRDWINLGDVSWVDDASMLQVMFISGMKRPDIIGPISRSPVKRYNEGKWESLYNKNWFYDGVVLRLNENEERPLILKDEFKGTDWVKKVSFIRHAIDLEQWKPSDFIVNKKYVLWAGMKARPAKNYDMFDEIMRITTLPEGYEFKVLDKYAIDTYNMVLDDTAILVNTSKYESFCNAVNEARAKGVCTLVQKKFNGDYMFTDQPIQLKYDAKVYSKKIMEILSDDITPITLGEEAREWAEKNISLVVMRKDITKQIKKVWKKKVSNNDKLN